MLSKILRSWGTYGIFGGILWGVRPTKLSGNFLQPGLFKMTRTNIDISNTLQTGSCFSGSVSFGVGRFLAHTPRLSTEFPNSTVSHKRHALCLIKGRCQEKACLRKEFREWKTDHAIRHDKNAILTGPLVQSRSAENLVQPLLQLQITARKKRCNWPPLL